MTEPSRDPGEPGQRICQQRAEATRDGHRDRLVNLGLGGGVLASGGGDPSLRELRRRQRAVRTDERRELECLARVGIGISKSPDSRDTFAHTGYVH